VNLPVGKLNRIIPILDRQRGMEPIGLLFDERRAIPDMVHDEIEDNANAIFLGLERELFEFLRRPEMLVDLIEIIRPIAMEGGISEEFLAGSRKNGTQPNLGNAEFFEIGKFFANAFEVAAVPTRRIGEIYVGIIGILRIMKAIYNNEVDGLSIFFLPSAGALLATCF